MLPGLHIPEGRVNALPHFHKGSLVAVCITGNEHPVAVGEALLDRNDVTRGANGRLHGRGFVILHHIYDELWKMGPQLELPPSRGLPEERSDSDQAEAPPDVHQREGATLQQEETVPETQSGSSVGAAAASTCSGTLARTAGEEVTSGEEGADAAKQEEPEAPTEPEDPVQAMDQLLDFCFFSAVKALAKEQLPMLVATFYGQHVQACCPPGFTLNIKQTSYKKVGCLRAGTLVRCVPRVLAVTGSADERVTNEPCTMRQSFVAVCRAYTRTYTP
jgi:translation initiation factor 2D